MIQLVYSPQWFYGKDIIIDIVGIIVLFLIGIFSIRSYRINKNKNYLWLGLSFFLISTSVFFKILTNFTIYYRVLETKVLPFGTLTYQVVRSSDTLFFIGYLLYRLLTLLGLYFLYTIYNKKQSKVDVMLIVYLIIISTYFSQSAYFIFHLTAFILLGLITYQYCTLYRSNRHKTTRMLAASFVIITLSHLVSCFVAMNLTLYVIAELIQLIGYTILLVTFFMVLKYGKKKKSN
jgi:hypothetical protein